MYSNKDIAVTAKDGGDGRVTMDAASQIQLRMMFKQGPQTGEVALCVTFVDVGHLGDGGRGSSGV